MPKTQSLPIDLPRIDAGTQSRLAINEDVVQDYADLIAESNGEWPFPPLDVFHDGSDYFVADGFHRLLGARRTKRGSIPCQIHKGTATDARIFGMTANDRHGLRMTRADKRACVEWLLDNGGKMTQAAISEKAGVTTRTVRNIVAERAAPPPYVERKISATRSGGTPDPSEDPGDPFEPPESPETAPEPETASASPKPPKGRQRAAQGVQQAIPKQFPRSHWFKQWEQGIGPLVRLVDRIADGVCEKHDPHHEAAQEFLEKATEEIMAWMGVKK